MSFCSVPKKKRAGDKNAVSEKEKHSCECFRFCTLRFLDECRFFFALFVNDDEEDHGDDEGNGFRNGSCEP